MIRVNLLEIKRKKKPKAIPLSVVIVGFLTLLIIIATVLVNIYLNKTVEKLTAQKDDNQKKIAELDKKVAKVREYESLIKIIEGKQNVIVQLRKDQSEPVKILDQISRLLPDNVWLSSLKVTGKNIKLSGSAFSNREVVKYVNNLKSEKLFFDVYLVHSQHKSIPSGISKENISIYNFNITMHI